MNLALMKTNFVLIRCMTKSDVFIKKNSGTESNESDEDDGIVVGIRTRKIRVIDSESESVSDVPQTSDKSEWTACHESKAVPPRIKFIPGERSAGTQVPSNAFCPVDSAGSALMSWTMHKIKGSSPLVELEWGES
ncbi:piggyBac transposable element-derived protein 4-like [Vespula squamosa]|uniref:PiggyBac transposable element-derived protein 4-like n=1 Tax=Vespula squamosa TaxID=30214 RepID=A0ABD2BG84_VESSQ